MAEITLVADPGRPTGSAASRRLRAAGRIPAVGYGHGGAGTSVSVDGRDLRHALSGEAGLNQLLSLKVGSDTHLALARAVQRHPVRHTVLHVDFQIVRATRSFPPRSRSCWWARPGRSSRRKGWSNSCSPP